MKQKDFIVEASAHYCKVWRENLPRKLFTLTQARKEALNWCSYADTIGGAARIRQVSTDKIVECA